MRDAAALYQTWSQQIGRHPDRDVAAEHRNLMELVLARDTDAAVDALTRHINRTTQILLTHPGPTTPNPHTNTTDKPPRPHRSSLR